MSFQWQSTDRPVLRTTHTLVHRTRGSAPLEPSNPPPVLPDCENIIPSLSIFALVCCSTFTRSYFKLAVHSCSFIHPPTLFLVFLSPHHHSICVHHACGSLTPIALCPILSGFAVNNLILTLPILLLSYSYLPLSHPRLHLLLHLCR
jgi:hypothetical protein